MKEEFYSYSQMALGVEVYFTRIGDFTWRVSDCEELVGLLTGENGDEMLISAFRRRKSISGPELVG